MLLIRQIRFNDRRVLMARYRDLLEVDARGVAGAAARRQSHAGSAIVAVLCLVGVVVLYVAACIGRGLS